MAEPLFSPGNIYNAKVSGAEKTTEQLRQIIQGNITMLTAGNFNLMFLRLMHRNFEIMLFFKETGDF